MIRGLALLLALVACAVPSASAKPSFVIVRDVSIGGFPRDGLVGRAVDVFGEPSGTANAIYDRCTLLWPNLGLTMETYYSQGALNPCGNSGRHVSTTVNDPRWRTSAGLRVGDRSGRLRVLYPKAVHQGKGEWWLILRPFAGEKLPGLAAQVRSKRIVSLTVYAPRVAF